MKSLELKHQPSICESVASWREAIGATCLTVTLVSGGALAGETKLDTPFANLEEGDKALTGEELAQYKCMTYPGRILWAMISDAQKYHKATVETIGLDTYVTFPDGNYFVASYDSEEGNFKVIRPKIDCDSQGKCVKSALVMDVYLGTWQPGENGKPGECIRDHLVTDKFECDGKAPCRPTGRLKPYNFEDDSRKIEMPKEPERDKRKDIKSAKRYVKR